jgi:sporulation protein YlmC with PRC-barrel domain
MPVAILFQKSKEVVMRQYFYFQSGSDPRLHAFTDDPTSEKLPTESGPWTLVRQMSPDEEWRHPASQAMVAAGVLENGFALWDTALGEGETADQPASSKPVIESDRVEGTAVYDTQGKHIGTVKRVVIEKVSGRVAYAVMSFGGFLGMGEHDIAVSMDKLKFIEEPVRTSATAPATTTRETTTKETTTGAATTTTTTARSADANDWTPDHAVMSGTKEQLKAMPQFKYSDYN